jgi:FAD/FMN-containing dehydrogenase
MNMNYCAESWGRLPKTKSTVARLNWTDDFFPNLEQGKSVLPFGLGRSYGDSCLNDGNTLLFLRHLDRFLTVDWETGVIRCEAGVTLDEILVLAVPAGWFLPTTPGTRFVTVGGALANDVHGKNHHSMGCFGNHVLCFELMRSDGSRMLCSPSENPDWFRATIGGLGLTGIITWVEFKLRKVESAFIEMNTTKFRNLDEFFLINAEAEARYEHTVAWIDCLSEGVNLGRGIYISGNHSQVGGLPVHRAPRLTVPFDAPNFLLNRASVKAFNFLYFNRQLTRKKDKLIHYEPFFYPLDAMNHWNRIYGKRGFFQYQSVVPMDAGREVTKEMLTIISRSGQASFLAVLKTFGVIESVGLMSFARRGITLALDFPNNGDRTRKLFDALDAIVKGCGGVLYPAKDGRMSAADFQRYYPQFEQLEKYRDPKCSSSFWRRVTGRA